MTDRRYRVDSTLPEDQADAWAPHLESAGWKRTSGEGWSLYLAGAYPSPSFYDALTPDQWVSRIPGIGAMAVKRDLCENLRWARYREGPGLSPIHPRTYLMPEDYDEWRAVAASEPECVWLLKPQASACARGIALIDDLDEVPRDRTWLVQEYVQRPHLLDQRKYGLRFYLLLTSIDPLVCYLHQVATCRFANRRYTLDPAARSDPFIHLTNTEIQKHSSDGNWWRRNSGLGPYRERLRKEGIDDQALLEKVRAAMLRMCIACREQTLLESRAMTDRLDGCFELLSVDVVVDDQLQPWILECNASPPMDVSAWKGTPLEPSEPGYDAEATAESLSIKGALMADTLSLLGFSRSLPQPRAGDAEGYWLDRNRSELAGAEGWNRLWPAEDADRYESAFPLLRPLDRLLAAEACPEILSTQPTLAPSPMVETHRLRPGLALYQPRKRRIHALNVAASAIWLGLADGLTPSELVRELADATAEISPGRVEADLWDLLVAWAQKGLLAGFELAGGEFECPNPGQLSVSAIRRGGALIVPMTEGLELDRVGAAEATILPAPGVSRLIGVRADAAPRRTQASAASILDLAAPGLVADSEQAAALIGWLDGLEVSEALAADL